MDSTYFLRLIGGLSLIIGAFAFYVMIGIILSIGKIQMIQKY